MKYTLLLIITLFAATQVIGQETRSKKEAPALTEPQLEIQVETIEREVQHIDQRLDRLRSAAMPEGEKQKAIRKAQIQELELQKMWKQKELAIAETESDNEKVVGLRGEAKALNERYKAAKDIRDGLEREAAAQQAEIGDETAVPNQKLELQKEKLEAQLGRLYANLQREQQSDNPDAERIAKLKGDIEASMRQINELDERR